MTIQPDAAAGIRHVFVRGLTVQARLGVHAHEKAQPQRVILGVDLAVRDPYAPAAEGPDELSRVVDYGAVAETARRIACAGHVRLAETLAERIALAMLDDDRVVRVRVSVEKPDVLRDVTSVGVVVERTRF
ncbi:dihydroneopterin aldolase [Roseomonas terrae]|jgi:dihydroneopterin aldolase|uniref:dihydroneopterin aldolase n=1 Tax=Neoroseomonas terrae TaxID=424799 RepID=A0ABS5EFJ0_9PROT|nr:dihydroneopterin aldolase [Neoroseomonas terrae]MBR0649781.1 dihydroneopterin aldolase [Neoroseomonas terrae]